MLYVYGSLSVLLLVMLAAGKKYGAEFFKGLDKKENPLRFCYGTSLKIYEIFTGIFPLRPDSKVYRMVKSLCVKENAKKEVILYYVKKISFCLVLLLAAFLTGFLYCAADRGVSAVKSLTRNEYGNGDASYELEVSYDGTEETVQIEIEERLYTEDEIYEIFDRAYEAVGEELLGENESFESVTEPLDLISDYKEIDIFWEVEDTDILDLNGEITADIKEGESLTITLYATFSIEDVTALYTYPVTLVSETLSDTELLVSYIMEAIEENNSVYESEVDLPEDIDGISIEFFETEENNEALFLILAVIALAAILLIYDKKLEDKMKKREMQMMGDLTEIVSKLSLLYEAGLSIYKALERIVEDHEKQNTKDHFAYQEMKLAIEKIKSGVSESTAYEEFGRRCGLHSYIKLGNILSQNLSKGSRGMKKLLDQEAESAFEERKRLARKKGEEAQTKLLFPMIMLLIIVIVIVAVPALMSMSL